MRLQYNEAQLRLMAETLRLDMVDAMHKAGSGHPGGSLSIAEIMSVLYFHEMNLDPQNPHWDERDRFVLSKGHAAPAYYAALAERGFFDPAVLSSLRQIDSILQGHPDCKKVPGVDISTGSLGQGISVACGMACAAKQHCSPARVYCILGDGEIQEGQVWEAAMSAAHYKLDNLVAFLDNNNLQIDGAVDRVMSVYPIKEKFLAFGWHVIELDGNNVAEILSALSLARAVRGKPTLLLSKTTKGKGVSFMENQAGWHGSAINDEQYAIAVQELNARHAEAKKGCEA